MRCTKSNETLKRQICSRSIGNGDGVDDGIENKTKQSTRNEISTISLAAVCLWRFVFKISLSIWPWLDRSTPHSILNKHNKHGGTCTYTLTDQQQQRRQWQHIVNKQQKCIIIHCVFCEQGHLLFSLFAVSSLDPLSTLCHFLRKVSLSNARK